MKPHAHPTAPFPGKQRGIALVVALVLLVATTILGLSGIRNTSMQERMSGNMYDRSLSMQSAEAALRAAEFAITVNADNANQNCKPDSGNACPPIPASTFGAGGGWTTAVPPFVPNFNTNNNQGLAAGAGQYFIEILGDGASEDEMGQANSANCQQDGGSCTTPTIRHYRVTARSHQPNAEGTDGRSLVVLQSWVRRAL